MSCPAGDVYWVDYVRERMPYAFANAFSWHLQTVPVDIQQKAATSLLTFAVEMSKAKTTELRRASRGQDTQIGLFSTTSRDGKGTEVTTKGTSKCGLRRCPSGKDAEYTCDVHGDLGPGRINTLMQSYNKEHKDQVDKKRQEAGRPAIDYSKVEFRDKGPKVNMHVNMHSDVAAADRALGFDANTDDEEADMDEVLANMSARWHQETYSTE